MTAYRLDKTYVLDTDHGRFQFVQDRAKNYYEAM